MIACAATFWSEFVGFRIAPGDGALFLRFYVCILRPCVCFAHPCLARPGGLFMHVCVLVSTSRVCLFRSILCLHWLRVGRFCLSFVLVCVCVCFLQDQQVRGSFFVCFAFLFGASALRPVLFESASMFVQSAQDFGSFVCLFRLLV